MHLRDGGCPFKDCKYPHVGQLTCEAEKARKEKGKGKGNTGDASVAFGYHARSIHFTPRKGQCSEVAITYEIPDDCSLDYGCSEDDAPRGERRVFEGLTENYLRALEIAYCTARNAAIDLAEGIRLLGREPTSHCLYDAEEWEGVEPCANDKRRRPIV